MNKRQIKKQMEKFMWKSNARIGVDPNVAGKIILGLEKRGRLTPESLLDEARKTQCPIHDYFEWDDSIAGEKFRAEQARYMIRMLEVEIVGSGDNKPVVIRAFHSLGTGIENGKNSRFHSIGTVMSDADLLDQAIRKAWNELLATKQRYGHLVELKEVWDAIDTAQKKTMKA